MAQSMTPVGIQLLMVSGRGPQGASFGAFIAKSYGRILRIRGFSEFSFSPIKSDLIIGQPADFRLELALIRRTF